MKEMISSKTDSDVVALLCERQAALGLSDSSLAAALGYKNAKVIALMKSGAMKVPLNKVAALARVLQVDGYELLRKVLSETAPDLWCAIQDIIAPLGSLNSSEVNLLRHLRQLRGDDEATPIVFSGKGIIALVSVE